MDRRLKGIALNLDLLRKDLEQRKAARALPRERSPSSTSLYSPSKTERGLKRSLSPTLKEVERLRRQAQSPRLRDWGKAVGEDGKVAGLSGISIPNSRSELINQYQKTPWEMPYQGTRPQRSKSPLDTQRRAADMLLRSLSRHLIYHFKHFSQQTRRLPQRRYASSSRLQVSVLVTDRERALKRQLSKGSPRMMSPAASPAWSDEYPMDSSNLRTAPSPKPLELGDLQLEPAAPRHRKVIRFQPGFDSPSSRLISSTSSTNLQYIPAFSISAQRDERYYVLGRLVTALERVVKGESRKALRELGVWAVRSESVGLLTEWLRKRVLLSYQQALYCLLFIPTKSRAAHQPYKPETLKRLLQVCAPAARAVVFKTQQAAFSAISSFSTRRSHYLFHLPHLISHLQSLFFPYFSSFFPLLRLHIKSKSKRKTRLKLHFRVCFRIFSIKRLQVLTRSLNRFRLGISLLKEEINKGNRLNELINKAIKRVLKGYLEGMGKEKRVIEAGEILKVRRLIANVEKNRGFRLKTAVGIWTRKSKETRIQPSFEANYISSLFQSLLSPNLSHSFSLLTHISKPRKVSSVRLFPLFLLLHIKIKAAQGLAFYKLQRSSVPADVKVRKAACRSIYSILSAWRENVCGEAWKAMQVEGRNRHIEAARRVKEGIGEIVAMREVEVFWKLRRG